MIFGSLLIDLLCAIGVVILVGILLIATLMVILLAALGITGVIRGIKDDIKYRKIEKNSRDK